MKLCFAALVKVLKICAKPKVYNKVLCGALIKTIDEYYGNILETDDSLVSHLLSCDANLSPKDVIIPARSISVEKISKGMEQYVIPLIDENMAVIAILALKSMALSTVESNNAKIGLMSRYDLSIKKSFVFSDFLADIFIFTVTEIENKSGKSTISHITANYVKEFKPYEDSIQIELDGQHEAGATSVHLPEEQADESPYSSEDNLLLQEFTADYDEIMCILISENYAMSLIDMTLPCKIKNLYKSKWASKADFFLDPSLKSYVYGLLGELNNISNSFLASDSATPFLGSSRTKIRNLYVKLHPDQFAGTFPYDAFVDDWDDGEY